MSETSWDEIAIDETLTEADQAAASNFDFEKQPGFFLCEVVGCDPVEKSTNEYSCWAAELKMKIHDVIEITQPVLDDEGKAVERDGEAIGIVKPVPEDKKAEFNAIYGGSLLSDTIKLYHRKESNSIKNRRIYVAQRLGLISPDTTVMDSNIWPMSIGKMVLVRTEWNSWQDKATKETKRNIRVGWTGYDYASKAGINTTTSKTESEDFDI